MRLLLLLLGTLFAHLVAPTPSSGPGSLIRLQADRIAFYYDRYLIEADGHVRVTTSDGETITGDAFSMDLKLNRFLIASHVHLTSPGGTIDGAAIADFLSFHRVYFVPVIEKPDRWTYVDGDYRHPLRGREMPGDVFYFPDVSSSTISLSAKSAVIGERAFARFEDVTTYIANLALPLPSFYVYFGLNRNLAVNSLSGANFDATWNATGDANAISAAHLRYDSANHLYASFEQHLADEKSYAVLSDNPATLQEHFWNLVAGHTVDPKLQVNIFTQLEETQDWFNEPRSASLVNYISATQAFNQSSLNATSTLINYNLVNKPYYSHPTQLQLTWSSFQHRIGKSPFYLQMRYGFGFNHDSYAYGPTASALQFLGGVPYTTIWNHVLGYTLSLPGIKFGDRDNPYHTYYFNAALDAQRQWNSSPHYVNSTSSTASVSRTFSRFVHSSVSYSVINTVDVYTNGSGYVPYAPLMPDGQPDYSFLAFRGAATQRIASIATTYSATPDLVTTLSYMHHDDFPIAVPGVFAPPPLNNLGQYLYSSWLGEPPDQLTGEVRARLLPHLVVDVQRTDYFNYGTLKWSPQFIVQFSQ